MAPRPLLSKKIVKKRVKKFKRHHHDRYNRVKVIIALHGCSVFNVALWWCFVSLMSYLPGANALAYLPLAGLICTSAVAQHYYRIFLEIIHFYDSDMVCKFLVQ